MPTRPRAACPSCRRLGGCGCDAARQQEADRARGSASSRSYDASWRARRERQLEVQPWCEYHLQLGQLVAATVLDHRIARRRLVAQGHPDPDGDWNLTSLCASCHGRKTVLVDGGYGRPALPPGTDVVAAVLALIRADVAAATAGGSPA